MEVQNRVVEAIVERLQQGGLPQYRSSLSAPGSTNGPAGQAGTLRDLDVSNLPSLMRSSIKQVADTVTRVLYVAESKDRRWRRREQKNLDRIRRLEAIIHSEISTESGGILGSHVQAETSLTQSNLQPSYTAANEEFHSPLSPLSATKYNHPAISSKSVSVDFSEAPDVSPQMRIPGSLVQPLGQAEEEDSEDSDVLMDMHDAEEDFENDVFYDAADGGLARNFTNASKHTVRSHRTLQAIDSSVNNVSTLEEASITVAKKSTLQTRVLGAEPAPSTVIVTKPSSNGIDNHSQPRPANSHPEVVTSKAVVDKNLAGGLIKAHSIIFPSSDIVLSSGRGYLPDMKSRTQIPLDPLKPKPVFQAWSFIKSAIGKDLSKVTLPVFFNEPLSMLQRMCEDVEFVELLSIASRIGRPSAKATPRDPARSYAKEIGLDMALLESVRGEEAQMGRLLFVAAYAMSNYSSTVGRTTKPFNPLLGETFELVSDEKQFRYVSEQVCHHPVSSLRTI
ncbi:hypothetical protein HDU96_002308 [Phlyctochytrium bullatum]|nr:hypothetical protein HDU96_002308 [Phlyctochytrium bullatum]